MSEYSQFDIDAVLPQPGEADFSQLLKVLKGEEPERPTLFEFFLNPRLLQKLSGMEMYAGMSWLDEQKVRLAAFQRAGYDYLTVKPPGFVFTVGDQAHEASISQNDGALIFDRKSMEAYPWQNPDDARYDLVEEFAQYVPDNMKLVVWGPGGVLENAISLVGYEKLCLLIMDDPEFALELFANIGSRLERYYQLSAQIPKVGACISNDDWGFKTQTLFSPRAMRKYIFPWHKKIVAQIHAAGKPAILHSCGNFSQIIEDIVEEMAFDARHSYEDTIWPVEEAYEALHGRIAVLGGIDVDFVCRSSTEAIYARSSAMLRQVKGRGGYALGTGNSVPEYVPDEGYFAMIRAALDQR
jgi:uroporphyrinogen decarboxylase